MNLLFKCLVALVVLAPLPLGAVHMWTWSLMGILVALMLGAWAGLLTAHRESPAVALRRIWPAATLFGIAVLWAFLQISPWMPEAWHHPLWAETARALGTEVQGYISINPFEGQSAILRLLMYAGIFWLALQLCRDRNHARIGLYAIAVAGAVYALYGIGVEISGTNTILWLEKEAHLNVLTSTFRNRNSYATYGGLGLLATTACLIDLIERRLHGSASRNDLIHKTITALTTEGRYLTAGWIALLTAVLLTASRGGTISTLFGMMVLLATLLFRQGAARTRTRASVATLLLAVLSIVVVSGGKVADRLAVAVEKGDVREVIFADTLEGIADHAYLGAGFGAFADTFRIYRDASLPLPVQAAHNTYLDNALELGLPAAASLVLSIGALAWINVLGISRRRRDTIYPCLGLSAVALVAVHSLFDFSLQIPAVTILFVFLLGMGCAQSWNTVRVSDASLATRNRNVPEATGPTPKRP